MLSLFFVFCASLASTAANEMKMLHDKRTTTDAPFPLPLPSWSPPYFISLHCLRSFLSCKFTFAFLLCTLFIYMCVSLFPCVCVCPLPPLPPSPSPSASACVCLCFYVIYLFKSISLSVFEHFVAICFSVSLSLPHPVNAHPVNASSSLGHAFLFTVWTALMHRHADLLTTFTGY